MKSKWIEYKGRRILFADYSDYGDDLDGLKQEVDDSDRLLMKEPKRSVRCVVDVTNTVGTKEAVELFKMSSKRTEPYVLQMGLVGITGVRKVLYQAVMRFAGQKDTKLFTSIETAKDWVIE